MIFTRPAHTIERILSEDRPFFSVEVAREEVDDVLNAVVIPIEKVHLLRELAHTVAVYDRDSCRQTTEPDSNDEWDGLTNENITVHLTAGMGDMSPSLADAPEMAFYLNGYPPPSYQEVMQERERANRLNAFRELTVRRAQVQPPGEVMMSNPVQAYDPVTVWDHPGPMLQTVLPANVRVQYGDPQLMQRFLNDAHSVMGSYAEPRCLQEIGTIKLSEQSRAEDISHWLEVDSLIRERQTTRLPSTFRTSDAPHINSDNFGTLLEKLEAGEITFLRGAKLGNVDLADRYAFSLEEFAEWMGSSSQGSQQGPIDEGQQQLKEEYFQ